jgi:hypothetical protein
MQNNITTNNPALPALDQFIEMQVGFLDSEFPVLAAINEVGLFGESLNMFIRRHADGRTLVGYTVTSWNAEVLFQYGVTGTMATAWSDIVTAMCLLKRSMSRCKLNDQCAEWANRYRIARDAAAPATVPGNDVVRPAGIQ